METKSLFKESDLLTKDTIVTHKKSKELYETTDLIKIKINDEWVDGVLYQKIGCKEQYARTLEDFIKKFDF